MEIETCTYTQRNTWREGDKYRERNTQREGNDREGEKC